MLKSQLKNQHPLKLWRSPAVLNLLLDFYIANFIKAGLTKKIAQEFVQHAWDNRETDNPNKIRRQCDQIILRAKDGVKLNFDGFEPYDLFDLNNIESFLDIGANKLNAINYYANKYQNIKEFIAVDVVPQSKLFIDEKRSRYFQVATNAEKFPLENNSIDLINIQYVLHHLPDLESVERILEICSKLIKPNGRLILWEETFSEDIDLGKLMTQNNLLNIKTDQELTKRFYDLSVDERWEFIIVNDWLINVSNSHMQWTGEYYTWPEWLKILTQYGFELEQEFNFGLRLSGRLKQGVQIVGIFKKT